MRLTYSTLAAAALFIAAMSNPASAQVTGAVPRTVGTTTMSRDTIWTVTGPNTASHEVIWTATGPNGRQASAVRSTTANGNGTVTHVSSRTGFGGRTRFATTTAGNGVATQMVTRRNGTVINRTRVR